MERINSIEPAHTRCIVLGCSNLTRATAREGLDLRLCRQHAEHHQRHGTPFRGSYKAAELHPHKLRAKQWIKAQRGSAGLSEALHQVRILYRSAGPLVPAFRLKGLPPEERARKAWARLREADVDPEKIIASWLTIVFALEADADAISSPEFQRVQAAKLVHRLASGTRKTWVQVNADGTERIDKLEIYPRSRGRILRILGKQIERACESLEIS